MRKNYTDKQKQIILDVIGDYICGVTKDGREALREIDGRFDDMFDEFDTIAELLDHATGIARLHIKFNKYERANDLLIAGYELVKRGVIKWDTCGRILRKAYSWTSLPLLDQQMLVECLQHKTCANAAMDAYERMRYDIVSCDVSLGPLEVHTIYADREPVEGGPMAVWQTEFTIGRHARIERQDILALFSGGREVEYYIVAPPEAFKE